MRKLMLPWSIPLTLLVCCLLSSAAQAQATRTWVSGVGDDANACSRTAPCQTFAGAISKTTAGGEIDALDPADYGTVAITKAITIDGGGGQVASILASSGANGILVQAGANDVITLRNLRINGVEGTGAAGLNGISYLSGGALHVQDCNIFGFDLDGISVATSTNSELFVNNTFLVNNGNGIQLAPTGGFARGMLVQVRSQDNSGSGFLLYSGAGGGTTLIADSTSLGNATGITVNGGQLYVGNSSVIRNNVGVSITAGTVRSYKTNMIDANAAGDGTPLTGIPLN